MELTGAICSRLAGASSPPLDEYRIDAVAQRYEFWIQALRAGDDPAELARKTLP